MGGFSQLNITNVEDFKFVQLIIIHNQYQTYANLLTIDTYFSEMMMILMIIIIIIIIFIIIISDIMWENSMVTIFFASMRKGYEY